MNSIGITEQNRTEQNRTVCSTRFLGSLLNQGPGFAGAVFDKNYLCPTITTCGGGGREPHIVMELENDK